MTPKPVLERDGADEDLPLADIATPSELTLWVRKNVTVGNALMLLVLLFQAGGWWQRQQNNTTDLVRTINALETRLTAAELVQNATANTYVRRDVLAETLRSMDDRLRNIETWMRNNGK